MRPRRLVSITTAVLIVALLAGCSVPSASTPPHQVLPAAPSPSQVPSPAPTPEIPAAIVLRGDSIELTSADGQLVERVPFSQGTSSVAAAVRSLLGPSVSSTSPIACSDSTVHEEKWGDALSIANYGDLFGYLNATAASYHGIAIETPGKSSVGSAASAIVADIPSAVTYDSTIANASYVWYDLGPGANGKGKSGVMVYSNIGLGTITSIFTPSVYFPNPDSSYNGGDC